MATVSRSEVAVPRAEGTRAEEMAGTAMGEPGIDYGRMLEVLDVEVELLASSAHRGHPDRVVPACPAFTLGVLVQHLGSMYWKVLRWLADDARPEQWRWEPRQGQSRLEYLREGYERLRERLAAHRADDPCSTWHPVQRDYGFWVRRMLHETTVHRCDVQATLGEAREPVAAELAEDGVDEVLTLWFQHRIERLGIRATWPADVLITARAGNWLVRMAPDAVRVEESRATTAVTGIAVDAVVRGDPEELYLWLWGRLPYGRLKALPVDQAMTSADAAAADGAAEFEDVTFENAVAQLWALLRLATK